jgi:hypothetical protein
MFEEIKPEEMTMNGLFRGLRDLSLRAKRLEELEAPEIIIEYHKDGFQKILKELMKYMNINSIEKEMESKWMNKAWKDDFRP